MSQIQDRGDLGNIEDAKEFMRHASILLTALVDTINGRLEFNNLVTEEVGVTFPVANTPTKVSHRLNKSVRFIVIDKNYPFHVFHPNGTLDTKDSIYLQSDVPGVFAALLLY